MLQPNGIMALYKFRIIIIIIIIELCCVFAVKNFSRDVLDPTFIPTTREFHLQHS